MKRKQDFALGLTAIMFAALFVATFFFLYPVFQGGGRVVTIHFAHEDGLAPIKKGSQVRLAGALDVGRVTSLEVAEIPSESAEDTKKQTFFVVRAEIRDDVPLYGDCQISSNQPAVGGGGFLTIIHVGHPDKPLKEPIKGLPPRSLQAQFEQLSDSLLAEDGFVSRLNEMTDPDKETSVLYKVHASLDDINAMTAELSAELSRSQRNSLLNRIHTIVSNFQDTTAALRSEFSREDVDDTLLVKVHGALDRVADGLNEATALLQDARPRIRKTLATVEQAVTAIEGELIADARREFDRNNPDSLVGKIHLAMDHLNASLENVETITSEGERAVAISRPALERTLENFTEMSDQLRLASQEVQLNPSKLIWGPRKHREEQMLVFQAARLFAEAAGELDQAAGRLESILKTLPPDGKLDSAENEELVRIRDAVQAAFERFEQAEKALWEQIK